MGWKKIKARTWKAISLKQPYANLICSGQKSIETRKWQTKYRGDLVICSSQNPKIEPFGKALCIVEVYDIAPMQIKDEQKACIKIYPKAHSWFLRNLRVIKHPIPVKGSLSIYDLLLPDIEVESV
ncbi:MAG: ASCH domain-containing protein [Patescibacteria group bacterium]